MNQVYYEPMPWSYGQPGFIPPMPSVPAATARDYYTTDMKGQPFSGHQIV